uniref:Embryogenesis transmembrane protein-like n=1 Tax=Oryza sativa subsp. japonica TaxID=39947 RepID=Q5VMW2_ORYSJ|nr:embryogenesis transmembrane protein-like [Oryza sativa Japonica Group]
MSSETTRHNQHDERSERNAWLKEMRGWLMVLATVAASVTYQAGLNPPGGFWQEDDRVAGHRAGDPVLRDSVAARYKTFYYFNSTAFVTSLVIMVLLMSERFYRTETKVAALVVTTFIDLASLVGAYIAGSTRFMSSCAYVIAITGVAFVSVIAMGEGRSPCMSSCYPLHGRAEGDGLPIHKAEDEEQGRGAAFHISSVDA